MELIATAGDLRLRFLPGGGQRALDEPWADPEVLGQESLNQGTYGWDQTLALGGEQHTECPDDLYPDAFGEVPGCPVVHDHPVGVKLEGQADRFGLASAEARLEDPGSNGLSQLVLDDPRLAWDAGRDLPRDGRGNNEGREESLQQGQLPDLCECDQGARVRDDPGHKDSLAAFSAAHSSSVMSMYGMPSFEACLMKSMRCMPRSSAALPLEMVPRR